MRSPSRTVAKRVVQSRDKRSREFLWVRGSRAAAPKLLEIIGFFCFPVIRRMLRRSMSFLPCPRDALPPPPRRRPLCRRRRLVPARFSSFALSEFRRVDELRRGSVPKIQPNDLSKMFRAIRKITASRGQNLARISRNSRLNDRSGERSPNSRTSITSFLMSEFSTGKYRRF